MNESRLFEDVKTAHEFGTGLALYETTAAAGEVSALEQGQRFKPDGTTEVYQRVEFDQRDADPSARP